MKECDEKNSPMSSKLLTKRISSNNGRHPVTKTFTPLHYNTPKYTSHNFNTLVNTSLLPI
jgi:hypothetical protein